MWLPPFPPPLILAPPPQVVMPDVHFCPVPPFVGMTFLPSMSPVALPMQVPVSQSSVKAAGLLPSPPPPVPAPETIPKPAPLPLPLPKSVEYGYQTITTTAFVPVGTLTEFCLRPEEKVINHQSVNSASNYSRDCFRDHPLVTSNFYGPMTTHDRYPEHIGITHFLVDKHEDSPIPAHTCAFPAVLKKGKQCNAPFPEMMEKPKRMEINGGLTEVERIELPSKECKALSHSPEASNGLEEKEYDRKYHHHHYYNEGKAYSFPYLVPISPMILSAPEQAQPTLATLTQMQDAIQRLEQACLVPVKDTNIDAPLETKPTAAYQIPDSKSEKSQHQDDPVLAPTPTTVDSKPPDEGPPQLEHSFSSLHPLVYQHATPYSDEDSSFLQQQFRSQYNLLHTAYFPVNAELPYHPTFNYPAAYQVAGQRYSTIFHPVANPEIPLQCDYSLPRRSRKQKAHKRTCEGSTGSSPGEGQKIFAEERNSYGSIHCEPDMIFQESKVLERERQEKTTETHQKYSTYLSPLQPTKPSKLVLLSTCNSTPFSTSSSTSSLESILGSIRELPGGISREEAKKISVSNRKNNAKVVVVAGDKTTLSQKVDTFPDEKAGRVRSLVGGALVGDLHLTAQERIKDITTQLQDSLQAGQEASSIDSVGAFQAFIPSRSTSPTSPLPAFRDQRSLCIEKNIFDSDLAVVVEADTPDFCPPLSSSSDTTPFRLFPPPCILHGIDSGSEGDISREESNMKKFGKRLLRMDEKEVATSVSLPSNQEENHRKCNCNCCEKRREKKDKQKGICIEKAKKKGKKKKEKANKKEKRHCHRCKLEEAEAQTKQRGKHGQSSKRGMLRDLALGACAGGLGYLVGTMVDQKQMKRKGYSLAHKPQDNDRTHESKDIFDIGGTYTLPVVPPTPPPVAHGSSFALARPAYAGWNDPHCLQKSGDECSRKGISIPKARPQISTTEKFHRQHYQDRSSTCTINLPKEMVAGTGLTKEGNAIHIKSGEGDRTPSQTTSTEIAQSVGGMRIHSDTFMRGTQHKERANAKQKRSCDGDTTVRNTQVLGARTKIISGFYPPAPGHTNITRSPAQPALRYDSSPTPDFPISLQSRPLQTLPAPPMKSNPTPTLMPISSLEDQSPLHEHILPPPQTLPVASMSHKEHKVPREKSEHQGLLYESELEVCKKWQYRKHDCDTGDDIGIVDPPLRMSMGI